MTSHNFGSKEMVSESKGFTLNDGRNLSYAEYGEPSGKPIFYFHGFPGSHHEAFLFKNAFHNKKTRIISVDRPGFSKSTFKRNRKLLEWPFDIIQLADYLKIDKFSVLGASGGGPYTLACAYCIPERIVNAGILGGCAPFTIPHSTKGMKIENILLFKLGKYFPKLLHIIFSNMIKSKMDLNVEHLSHTMPLADQVVCNDPEIKKMFIADLQEAFLQGPNGAVQDVLILGNKWGFNISDISMHIHIWQGKLDINVPPQMGKYLSDTIPSNDYHFFSNEGHLSIIFNNAEDILSTISVGVTPLWDII